MDNLEQRLPPDHRGRAPIWPSAGSWSSGESVWPSGGSESSTAGQTSNQGCRQDDQEAESKFAESKFEEESLARMHSLVNGLLQDEGREHHDTATNMLLPEVEFPNGTTTPHSLEQELLWQTLYQDLQNVELERAFQKRLGEVIEGSFREYVVEFMWVRNIRAAGQFAARENLRQQEASIAYLRTVADSILQYCSLERNCEELTQDALAGLFFRYICEGYPADLTGLAKASLELLEHRIKLRCDEQRTEEQRLAILSQMSQCTFGMGFSPLQSTPANSSTVCPPSATSDNFTAENIHSAALGPRSGDLRQENVRSRNRGKEKVTDGPCNSYSPLRQNSTKSCTNGGAMHTPQAADKNLQAKFVSGTGFHRGPSTSSSPPITYSQNGNASSSMDNNGNYHPFQKPFPGQNGSKYHASKGSRRSRPTKALIAQGEKSFSIIIDSDNSASRYRRSYPASPSTNGSTPVSSGSESVSPIGPRRLDMNIEDLQVVPMENPSVELKVGAQGSYKTELCRNWEQSQWCRYGNHCKFAHGLDELRGVFRDKRYKTEPCHMIMAGKECIYGHRCHFRHSFSEKELYIISEATLISRR